MLCTRTLDISEGESSPPYEPSLYYGLGQFARASPRGCAPSGNSVNIDAKSYKDPPWHLKVLGMRREGIEGIWVGGRLRGEYRSSVRAVIRTVEERQKGIRGSDDIRI